ncbi:hypothetical protein [Alteripontixanthobacter maritimus]|uniref:hypothetical protein n=1 Tax=Alteripontixanthobacter maritimus TaxID=2161824 RepID=UPI0015F01DC7|nr:hypothetical protein [Alteripontixanthobacter maritimus]
MKGIDHYIAATPWDIAQALGGTLPVGSAVEGTRFAFRMPLNNPTKKQQQANRFFGNRTREICEAMLAPRSLSDRHAISIW